MQNQKDRTGGDPFGLSSIHCITKGVCMQIHIINCFAVITSFRPSFFLTAYSTVHGL